MIKMTIREAAEACREQGLRTMKIRHIRVFAKNIMTGMEYSEEDPSLSYEGPADLAALAEWCLRPEYGWTHRDIIDNYESPEELEREYIGGQLPDCLTYNPADKVYFVTGNEFIYVDDLGEYVCETMIPKTVSIPENERIWNWKKEMEVDS